MTIKGMLRAVKMLVFGPCISSKLSNFLFIYFSKFIITEGEGEKNLP